MTAQLTSGADDASGAVILLEHSKDAFAACHQALSAYAQSAKIYRAFSAVLRRLQDLAEAIRAGQDGAAANTPVFEAYTNLGDTLRDCAFVDEAIGVYRHAATLQPRNHKIYAALGNVLLQARDQVDEAQAAFRQAYKLRPLDKRAAAKSEPDFSVLLINAPGIVNTPSDYLIGDAPYDSYFFTLMPGVEYDLEFLRESCDVAFNLIGDADLSQNVLTEAIALFDRIDRPIVNHPRKILNTGRDAIAARLTGIPGCRVPTTRRFHASVLSAVDLGQTLAEFAFPLLVRLSGAHGGEQFEKFADIDAVRTFVARQPAAEFYVTEYIPYESADGYFRKYRLIFLDGQILPYHLAIDRSWKVHHFSTDMANQEWMRKEEAAFVANPAGVFQAEQWSALQAIRDAIGLDYFGIDCSLDRDGDIVVFEVNATMLVHGEEGIFAYKNPQIRAIKQAFDGMLARRATAVSAALPNSG